MDTSVHEVEVNIDYGCCYDAKYHLQTMQVSLVKRCVALQA